MEKTDCNELNDLRKDYENLKQKYGLPEFTQLAEDFDVEKVAEKETDFLLREIRRAINDKTSAYLHLFEMLMNPGSSGIFIFSILKNLDESDKKIIKEVYKKLAKLQIKTMQADTIYSEENEAGFISETFEIWQEMKTKINKLLEKFDKKFDENNNSDKRGYFG